MKLQLLVAVAENGIIGKDNNLIWHISKDLRRFKRLTKGHPIIMGRKTFESIGRPLPGRVNIIMSKSDQEAQNGCVYVKSVEEALAAAKTSSNMASIIGGESIYALFQDKVDVLHLTVISERPEGDAFYTFSEKKSWQRIFTEKHEAENNQPAFRFESYIRR